MFYTIGIIMFYTPFQRGVLRLINYICGWVLYCGGHHNSDRIPVLVMVSQAETIYIVL